MSNHSRLKKMESGVFEKDACPMCGRTRTEIRRIRIWQSPALGIKPPTDPDTCLTCGHHALVISVERFSEKD